MKVLITMSVGPPNMWNIQCCEEFEDKCLVNDKFIASREEAEGIARALTARDKGTGKKYKVVPHVIGAGETVDLPDKIAKFYIKRLIAADPKSLDSVLKTLNKIKAVAAEVSAAAAGDG